MPTAVHGTTVAAPRPQLWRVTDRATFVALRRSGRRVRRPALTVTFLAPDGAAAPTPPRVAFTVGKATGGAVVRNRVRRRLRAALRELHTAGRLPRGTYLLGASAMVAQMPWSALCDELADAIEEASR
jgi:ribonuclease P protein component